MARFRVETQKSHSFVFQGGEKGYPWIFFYVRRSWLMSLVLSLLVVVPAWIFYNWYVQNGTDAAPDSTIGYTYAIAGTLCLILALLGFSLHRRSHKRRIGQLNRTLNWHMFFGLTGLALLFVHSFGNFNPRTGTYALYGMIAMTISGVIGRILDQVMPRLITGEVDKALTGQGEDRVDRISQQLQALVTYNNQGFRSFKPVTPAPEAAKVRDESEPLSTPWDLAYISLDATPQELGRDASYRYVPDKKSSLTKPGALIPGVEEQVQALKAVQKAMQREQFYRYVIRYWRILHIGLALLTVGLTIWHLVYAAQLIFPTLMH